MKNLFFLALFSCALFTNLPMANAEVKVVKMDPPPILTYYCGVFSWSGSENLPAGTYQVLSDLDGDHTTVLYIYDSWNNVSYPCFASSMDFSTSTASIYVSGTGGFENVGLVSVY